jgi:8-oxo-dGTP pyrophosphatase MutT (NUDIX family)
VRPSLDRIDWLTVLDEVRAIAQTGLHYATDPYDRERCTRLLDLATRGYAEALDLPEPEVRARLARDLGYVSAKVGADAAIFDDDGRVLLVHRADDLRWGLISGWVDPGETPTLTVVREVREEVGLDVTAYELVDVVGRPAGTEFGPHAVVSVLYLCAVAPGEVTISHEAVAAAYRHVEDVDEWHANHELLAGMARDAWRDRRA